VDKIGKNSPKMEFFDFLENSHFLNVIVPRLEKRYQVPQHDVDQFSRRISTLLK
jgi:hypothetical protein